MNEDNQFFVMRRRGGKLISPLWGPFDTRGEASEFLEDLRTIYPEAELCSEQAALEARRADA